jgi:hypothetical protein
MRSSPGPEGHKVEGIQSGWCPRCRAGASRPRWCGASQASSSHSHCRPGRTTGDGLRALSPRAKARRCAGFARLCLHPGRRVSNGSFHGTFRNASLQRAFGSVRTAEIGGRSRQAEDDHQGRAAGELTGSILDRDPLFRKAIGERLGEKICGEDDLWEVAKSAVWAETQMAGEDGRRRWRCGPQWWKPHCIGRRETGAAVAAT